MPHLHEEKTQVLLDMTLEGERKVNLATSYVTCSEEVKVGTQGYVHWDMQARGRASYSCGSQDKISRVWTMP